MALRKFIIERDIPKVGNLERDQRLPRDQDHRGPQDDRSDDREGRLEPTASRKTKTAARWAAFRVFEGEGKRYSAACRVRRLLVASSSIDRSSRRATP